MKELFSLGKLNTSDFLPMEDNRELPKYELKLMLDDDLGCVRLNESAPLGSMYGKYWYRSGINQTMRDELKNIVESILHVHKLKENDIWVDIGCNDGTLFEYLPKNIIKVGVDPADDTFKIESDKKADVILQNYFTFDNYQETKFGKIKAKVITAIAMFYDLEKPDEFLKDVHKIMDDNGLFVIQMSYTPLMLKQMAFDNICFKPNAIIDGINKKISDIKIGDTTLGYDGKPNRVLNTFERDYKGYLYKIKPEYVDYIEPTSEHPIWIVRKDNIKSLKKEWIKAKDINVGDYVIIPKIKHTEKNNKTIDLTKYNDILSPNYRRGLKEIELNDDILWMMGLYVAKGHIWGRENNLNITFTLNKNEIQLINKLERIFNSIGYKIKVRDSKISNETSVNITCSALVRLFREWFGKRAINKKIPNILLYLDDKNIISFINGIINGDFYFNRYLNLHTFSKILLNQLQILLARLNIMTSITRIPPQKRIIRGGEVISKESWILRGSSKIISEYFETTGIKNNKLRYLFDDDYIYVRIKNITAEYYEGKVYNIETVNNTYLTSNIVVHNCHEHIYYYSLFNIKKLLEKNGFKVVDCTLNDINGGSFRVFVKKDGHENEFYTQPFRDVADFRINSLLRYEKTLKLDQSEIWLEFFDKLEELKKKTATFIKKEIIKGKVVWAYGASTKGNTTLQYFGLDNSLIAGIAERNPLKWGLKTIGTNIPIYSEDDMRKAKPDYLLVLPWHFINEFKEREKEYLIGGGKFIVPCPIFEIIGY